MPGSTTCGGNHRARHDRLRAQLLVVKSTMATTASDEAIIKIATLPMEPSACPIAGPTETPPQIPDESSPSACARRLNGAMSTTHATAP